MINNPFFRKISDGYILVVNEDCLGHRKCSLEIVN
jgi:hypothetical protein